jgi:hypothetical protein
LFEAAKFHVRQAGLLGDGEQQRANIENEIFKAQGRFILNNIGNIAEATWDNKGSILQSTISGQPASLQFNGSLGESLRGNVEVGGLSLPAVEFLGGFAGGAMRTEIGSDVVSNLRGSEIGTGGRIGVAALLFGVNAYGYIREQNANLHHKLDNGLGIISGMSYPRDSASSTNPLGPKWKQ